VTARRYTRARAGLGGDRSTRRMVAGTLSVVEPTAIVTAAANASESPPPWFLPTFPFFFAALWIVVTTLLAFLAGHMTLLASFPPVDERAEETFRFASGRMRWVSFNNALHVGIGARGLHLAASWLFRPLFRRKIPCIPWREIRLVRSQPQGVSALFIGSKFEIPAVTLRFTLYGKPGRTIERKLASLGSSSPAATRRLVREV
jgi:hypothetical protein